MTLTYRRVKGVQLTPDEADGNMDHLLSSANHTFLSSGTGALAETVQAYLRKGFVFADSYSGASVAAQIDAAIAAAAGRVVIIPPTMGAGEGTTYSVSQAVIDLRGANASGSGGKIAYNFSDSGGHDRLLVIDDQTNPTLSNAAALLLHRPTGTLPNNANGEGAQITAQTTGALSNSPTGYILSGLEAGVTIGSTGQTLSKCWGLHSTASTGVGSTTNVTDLVSIYAVAPAKSGSGTITNAYSIYAEDPGSIASGNNYSIYSAGNIKIIGTSFLQGDLALNRNGVASNSSFLSGGAANYYFVDIGTTAGKLRLAAAGATNDFITGSAQGDGLIFTIGSNTLWLGTGSGIGQVKITHTASAANQLVLTGAASGANASINVTAENLLLGSGSAIATTATAGYVMFPSCAGTPTGVPTGQAAGKIPMVFDTSGVKLWFYTGGAWKGVVVA